MTNGTTWENTKSMDIDYMRAYPAGSEPFSNGLVQNLLDNCCHSNKLREWELPDIDEAWREKDFGGFNLFNNRFWQCC